MPPLEQVAEGVHRYADGLVNWYVIEEDGALALIDAGWPRSWSRVEAALAELGRRPADIAAVLLTHGHGDHLGAAERARRESGATVYAHRDEIARVTGNKRGGSSFALVPSFLPHLWRPASLRFVLHATKHGFLTPQWVKEVTPYADGERIDAPGHPVAIATPGHTEGHASFVLPERGILFTGDALVMLDPLLGEPGPRVPHPALNVDDAQAHSSLAALEGVEAQLVLPGHGPPWKGTPAAAVAHARGIR